MLLTTPNWNGLLVVLAALALVVITPRIVSHTAFTTEAANKAPASACVRQMPQYRPNPGNKC